MKPFQCCFMTFLQPFMKHCFIFLWNFESKTDTFQHSKMVMWCADYYWGIKMKNVNNIKFLITNPATLNSSQWCFTASQVRSLQGSLKSRLSDSNLCPARVWLVLMVQSNTLNLLNHSRSHSCSTDPDSHKLSNLRSGQVVTNIL